MPSVEAKTRWRSSLIFILVERVEDRVLLHAELLLDYKRPPVPIGEQL